MLDGKHMTDQHLLISFTSHSQPFSEKTTRLCLQNWNSLQKEVFIVYQVKIYF